MKLYANIYKYMQIYAIIWKYMKLYANICKYMQIYANICKYIKIYESICKYMKIFANIWKHIAILGENLYSLQKKNCTMWSEKFPKKKLRSLTLNLMVHYQNFGLLDFEHLTIYFWIGPYTIILFILWTSDFQNLKYLQYDRFFYDMLLMQL